MRFLLARGPEPAALEIVKVVTSSPLEEVDKAAQLLVILFFQSLVEEVMLLTADDFG